MTEILLSYFEKELHFLQQGLRDYGAKYPNEAKNLGVHQMTVDDPSLARMLEGMALLTAKMEYKIDNQFNQVISDLLAVLFPIYNFVFPSVTYLEFKPKGKGVNVTIPKGIEFCGHSEQGKSIFTSVAAINIHPFDIASVNTFVTPFDFQRPKGTEQCDGLIQLKLVTGDDQTLFSQLSADDLTIFIHGIEFNVLSLVDRLLGDNLVVGLSTSDGKGFSAFKKDDFFCKVSDTEFNYLPQQANELSGFHQLCEYINYKRKGQFFQLTGFGDKLAQFDCSEVLLHFYVDSLPSSLRQSIGLDTFKFNVFPVINLFKQRGEPITYYYHTMGIPVIADTHANKHIEIVDVLSVYELTAEGEKQLSHVFDDKLNRDEDAISWQMSKNVDGNIEIILSLDEQDWSIESLKRIDKKVITTQLLCSNGDEACSVNKDLECLGNIDINGSFICLYPPTKPVRPTGNLEQDRLMVSLLSCNFNTILQSHDPTKLIKKLLLLFCRNIESSKWIENIRHIGFKHQVAPIRISGKNIFASGTEILITLNTVNIYQVFITMLNVFFQQICSFDRFVQLKVYLWGKDDIVKCFPRFHGSKKHI